VNAPKHGKPWECYESVAVNLLNRFATVFGLDRVEGKQKINGKTTAWQIDAKGVRESDGATILVECRRKKRKLDQETLGAIAYRIQDTGAERGIVVTPWELQSGAARIADAGEIIVVQLDTNSTPTDFAMRFLGRLMVGASVHARAAAGAAFDAKSWAGGSVQSVATAGASFDAQSSRRCSSCGKQFPLVDYAQRRCPQCESTEEGQNC
jgi:hypothetical protein